MSKKSIFYTTAAIALTIVMFITYSAYSTYKLSDNANVIQTRIETVNLFIRGVERDVSKGVIIAGFRTFLSFNDFIADNSVFLGNVSKRFKESFINGTINNLPQSLMTNYTFTNWTNKVSKEADKIDIKINFTINEVKVDQSDPWFVDVGLNLSLYVTDKKNTSIWVRNRYFTTKISIMGLKDPLYTFNTSGKINNTIFRTNITDFVIDTDVTNLMIHTNKYYYIAYNGSPSFLMRFEGNLSNSTFGIESLTNLDKFLLQGFPLADKSVVDSVYFGTESTTNYRINKTPSWFKLDEEHLEIYDAANVYCKPSDTVCVTG
ncbi:MAG: hypothetical protein Q8R04_04215 [Nanoarchaeota archaeon]|nr:hypothetical protein [Nanoarchaeota archaeon]